MKKKYLSILLITLWVLALCNTFHSKVTVELENVTIQIDTVNSRGRE